MADILTFEGQMVLTGEQLLRMTSARIVADALRGNTHEITSQQIVNASARVANYIKTGRTRD